MYLRSAVNRSAPGSAQGVAGKAADDQAGKASRIPMATIGQWNRGRVMDEEYLFWDNQAFLKPIGLAQ
jgi:hypothetical protein